MVYIWKNLPILFLFMVSSCFIKEGDEPEKEDSALSNAEKLLLQEAYQLPGDVYRNSFYLIGDAIDAVYYASAYSGTGQITIHGTLDLRGDNPSYNASPDNQLIVRQTGGSAIFIFDAFNTELSVGDLRDNMQQSHQIAFRASRFGEYDVEVASELQNGYRKLTIKGQVEDNSKTYDLDLEANGDYFFNVDNTGSELLINDQYAGVINCAEWNAEIQESWYYNNVYSSSAGANAENVTRSFTNSYLIGDAAFRFDDGRIQTVFRDGKPNEYDVANPPWMARGKLLKENNIIGELGWNQEGSFIKIFLTISEEKIELQSWRIQ